MLVWIVYMPTPDKLGPDVDRMNRVEEVPDELGRVMLQDGSARQPTDNEVAAYQQARQVEQKAADAAADGDLTKLSKAELVKLAEERGVEVPPHATKADIVAALEEHGGVAGVVDVPLPDDAGAEEVPAARQAQ